MRLIPLPSQLPQYTDLIDYACSTAEELGDVLELCIDSARQSSDMIPGMRAILAWSERSLQVPADVARQSLSHERQELLCDVIWEAFDAAQPQIAPLARDALSNMLDALASDPTKQQPTVCRLSTLLMLRALSNVYRKKAIFALETFSEKYGPGFFADEDLMNGCPLSEIFGKLIEYPKGFDVGNRRRGKLALVLLEDAAIRLGVQHAKGKLVREGSEEDLQRQWDAWCSIWLEPLAASLLRGSTRQKWILSAHFLNHLFVYSNRAMHELLYHLTKPTLHMPSTSDTSASRSFLRAPAVLCVLCVGKQMGLVSTSGLEGVGIDLEQPLPWSSEEQIVNVPAKLLRIWVDTPHHEVSVGALGLIAASRLSAMPLSKDELDVCADFLGSSFQGVSPESRTAIRGFYQQLLSRLRASTHAAARAVKGEANHIALRGSATAPAQVLSDAEAFLNQVASMIRRWLHAGSSYPVTATALTYLEYALEAGLDDYELSAQSAARDEQFPFTVPLADASMTQALLQLLKNRFEAVSNKAFSLLKRFPKPLPSLESHAAVQGQLVNPIIELMRGARDFESHNASLHLDLYYRIYINGLGWKPIKFCQSSSTTPSGDTLRDPSLQMIEDVLDFVEEQLAFARANGLSAASEGHPLMGGMACVERLYSAIAKDESLHSPSELDRVSQRILDVIDRVWEIVSPVLCSSAPEGNTGEVDERSRAMAQVEMEDELLDEEIAPEEASGMAPKFQIVLTYAWRSIKAASVLLSTVGSSMARIGQSEEDWDERRFDAVGQRFIHWLLNVRHRGAFSTIYPAFSEYAATLLTLGTSRPERKLPEGWLQSFLDKISSPSNALSVTRRSAGLGFSVVALLTALKGEVGIVGRTLDSLVQACDKDEQDPTSVHKTSQIHAFNTLRYILADGVLASTCKNQLSPLIPLSISRFSSTLWPLRNAALMLFAAVSTRVFALQMVNRRHDPLDIQFREFTSRLPNIERFLSDEIERCRSATKSPSNASSNEETRLFSMLMMLSKVRPSDSTDVVEASALCARVELCLDSPLWKLREMAAHALVALLPDEQKIATAVRLAEATHANSNAAHGAWLAVLHLLRSHRGTLGLDKMASVSPIFAAASECTGDASIHPLVRDLCTEVLSGDIGRSRNHALLARVLQAPRHLEDADNMAESARRLTCTPHLEGVLVSLAKEAEDQPAMSHQALQVIYASSDETEVSIAPSECPLSTSDIDVPLCSPRLCEEAPFGLSPSSIQACCAHKTMSSA